MHTKSHGFTLLELLIALAIFGFVMGAFYSVFITSDRAYRTQDGVAEAQQGLRVGLDLMVRDIRLAGLDPLDTAGAGFEEATETKVRFTMDEDMNGAIDDPIDSANPETLTYEFDNANQTLQRGIFEGTAGEEEWHILISNVSDLTFTYLDEDGDETAISADIRTVIISMTCEGSYAEGTPRTLTTRVRCRNL